MDKNNIISTIEKFAPLELSEKWDCSGWLVETCKKNIEKVMLCLTVTDEIVRQARLKKCDMIISHHPLFQVSIKYKDIDIYCAHTNLDYTNGGTTDVLADKIFESEEKISNGFLRYVDCNLTVSNFVNLLRRISPHLRYVNNLGVEKINRVAFCAGSGSEFINEVVENGADAFVTGDIKFHTAVESKIVLFDIGHFESEIGVLKVFENLLKNQINIVYAKEQSSFKYE